ncbi:MAG: ATP-binding cassette domain-containing protein [Acidobacteria bacterium]|nr:ATP-binding cassette domain-containing protein [Acidobacteriota bacterium]
MSAVEVNNLSKLYFLGERKSNSLREVLAGFGRSGARRELWALRDVSFKVEAGETLGIIGRNGAGKSTLLKILSRVTKPTSGTASLSGRVGSLLEVGTGFHNELSGRDNIFLNGAILGMKRTEIARKFDEIVSFAEIEAFLDTPVKHYSSGMYMRLAFAIAAHLDTEILIVDEVLAVGDAEFQKKCLGKMQDIRESGRTVLFVSHDMAAITRVCSRAIAFNKGEIVDRGESAEVVRSYLTATWRVDSEKNFEGDASAESAFVRLNKVRVVNGRGETAGSHEISERIGIESTYEVLKEGEILLPNIQLYNHSRQLLFTVQDVTADWIRRPKERGVYTSTVWIPGNFMAEGTFYLNYAIVTHYPQSRVHLIAHDAVSFDVVDRMTGNNTARGDYVGTMEGLIRPVLEWSTEFSSK